MNVAHILRVQEVVHLPKRLTILVWAVACDNTLLTLSAFSIYLLSISINF